MQRLDFYKWFSLPIEIKEIPSSCEFVPVSYHINLTKCLESVGECGIVDERSMMLYRITHDANEIEEPYQFSPDIESRHPQRQLITDNRNVSWVSEWRSDQKLSDLLVKGVLTWIASGNSKYKLIFGVPSGKIAVQVPFLPNNLRHFDSSGKPTPLRWFPAMQIKPQWHLGGSVYIFKENSLITSYHTGPLLNEPLTSIQAPRRPYFYPLNGPDGIGLTELGKPHDPTGSHAHHYSLWIAHNNIGENDFWSEKGGLICHEQFELMEDGALFARLVQKTKWIKDDEVLMNERRKTTIYATPGDFRLLDIELEFSTNGLKSIEIGKTPFGFLSARVAQSMTVFDGGGEIINSEGQRNEQFAFWQRAKWIDQSGPIAPDRWGGIALFDHPENPNYPTAWHCRNDGWAGASFNLESSWKLESENSLNLKYRILLHRHNAEEGEVPVRYNEYICSPKICVGDCKIIDRTI